MHFLFYFLGFLPSAIWLLFYLRKDSHPESNRMILITFFFGMLSAGYALILELAFREIANFLKDNGNVYDFLRVFFDGAFALEYSQLLIKILLVFIGGALIEELAKYFVLRLWVFQHSELDEPVDLVLYMIIAALGFAAIENVLFLINYRPPPDEILTPLKGLIAMGYRFISATFLHALSSAIFGAFIALSFHYIKKRRAYFLAGLVISCFLHGIYNWYIMLNERLFIIILLIGLSLFVGFIFEKLKKLKSICLPNNDG